MKRIIAFVKKNMLDDVVFALHRIENFRGLTSVKSDASGVESMGMPRGAERKNSFGFPISIKVDIICSSIQVEEIVETITREAHTGLPGDGSVIVCPVDEVKPI